MGTIVSTSIFTLPGVVAAEHAGPAVALSFLLAAIVAGLVAFTYAEMASTMPFAGSAYSWINVLFGEFFWLGCRMGLISRILHCRCIRCIWFLGQFKGLIKPLGIELPKALSNPLGSNGGVIDIVSAIVIILTALLLSRGMSEVSLVWKIF